MPPSANLGPLICGGITVVGAALYSIATAAVSLTDGQEVLGIVFPILLVVLVAVGVVVKAFLTWDARREHDRDHDKAYAALLAEKADSQHAAILAGGDKLAWGFYGSFAPAAEFNVFSDHWDDVLDPPEPEPEPEPEIACTHPRWFSDGYDRVICADCKADATVRDHDYQRCHCPACGAAREATGGYVKRMGLRRPVAEVRAFGERDPKRVVYSPSEVYSSGSMECTGPDDEDDDRDWYDER